MNIKCDLNEKVAREGNLWLKLSEVKSILIAIDPGTNLLGYSLFDIKTKELLYSHLITFNKKHTLHRKLTLLYRHLKNLIKDNHITWLAIENVYFTHRNAIPLLAAIYEIKELAKRQKLKLYLVNVRSARKYYNLKGDDIKEVVSKFITKKFNLTSGFGHDIIDSILIGIYVLDKQGE